MICSFLAMIKLRFVHSLLFFTAICFFLPKIAARGGHSDYIQPGDGNASFHGTARHLFAQEEKRPSVELTRGYMTNADLEKAMKDFTKRCSKISRLYRVFWNVLSASGRVSMGLLCGS